jgi:hypothetical protein
MVVQSPAPALELVQAVLAKDGDGTRRFIETYGSLIRYWVRTMAAYYRMPQDLTDDFFQEVLVALLRSDAARLRAWNGTGSLEGYL